MDSLPRELRTRRLVLRAWRGTDADALRPVLLANQEHLKPWIPESTWSAPPLPQLAERLDEWSTNFSVGRAFRYALRDVQDHRVLGGMSLFPRNDAARVPLDQANRLELGYWLDSKATGQGLVTEAARALLVAATVLRGLHSVEIHCHLANTASNAVPPRLGFTVAEMNGQTQIWRRPFVVAGGLAGWPDCSDFPSPDNHTHP